MRGNGFTFRAPAGWELVDSETGARTARSGGALVSVTRFPLAKNYDPQRFDAVTAELDRVAGRLAQQAGADLSDSSTVDIAGRKSRAYRYGDRRVAFVLVGKREYQLYCRRADDACDLLFSSFALSGPQA